MKWLQKILEMTKFNKAMREGEARLLDTLVASGIIVLITALYGRIEASNEAILLLAIAVLIGWCLRIALRKD